MYRHEFGDAIGLRSAGTGIQIPETFHPKDRGYVEMASQLILQAGIDIQRHRIRIAPIADGAIRFL